MYVAGAGVGGQSSYMMSECYDELSVSRKGRCFSLLQIQLRNSLVGEMPREKYGG